MDQELHIAIIELIIAYTFTGVIVFTAITTSLALIGVINIAPQYMKTLFAILIVELVVGAVGFFLNFMRWDPWKVQHSVQASAFTEGKQQGVMLARQERAASDALAAIENVRKTIVAQDTITPEDTKIWIGTFQDVKKLPLDPEAMKGATEIGAILSRLQKQPDGQGDLSAELKDALDKLESGVGEVIADQAKQQDDLKPTSGI